MTWTTVCLLDGCAKAMEEDILAVFEIPSQKEAETFGPQMMACSQPP